MIIAIGDVHGEFVKLYEKIRDIDERGVNFIQVGDFGLGFDSPMQDYKILNRLNDHLRGKESMMYVIRGNHDNPSFWSQDGSIPFSNIIFVPDNTIITIEGMECLFAGGAPSIDRRVRTKGVSFWNNECYKYEPVDVTRVDLVFTHEVYHGASNFSLNNDAVKYFAANDSTLMDYLVENQVEMERLYSLIESNNDGRYVKWYHGHYHKYDVWSNGLWLDVTCLGILEFKEVR